MFEKGIFGGMFDLNRDGKMDTAESALEFMFIDEMSKEERNDSSFDAFNMDSDNDSDEADELTVALEAAGIDEFDLEFMDEDEREAFFEDAGLDIDDYDI